MLKKQQDDLEFIEGLAKLMKEYQLDVIDLGTTKLLKSYHNPVNPAQTQIEDNDLFYSSSD